MAAKSSELKLAFSASPSARGRSDRTLTAPTEIDENYWAERCAFWAEQAKASTPKSRSKRENRPVLVLTGHGVRLNVENGVLVVRNGFTHHPQTREEWRFFSGTWRVPSRIVVLDAKGGLTFHALRWLAERDIPLVCIDWQGNVVHVVGGSGYAIDRKLADVQLVAKENGHGLTLARWLIAEKITNCMATLRASFSPSPAVERALQKLDVAADELKRSPPSTISGLLGIEGRAGYAYFAAWRSFPLRWKGTGQRPIPEDWKRIGQRSSYASKKSNPNRHATHPVNAILNYAYAVLETRVRAHVVGAGFDPTVGFFHGNYPAGKTALVYDLMEPLRPAVDRAVLEFVQRHTFAPADFMLGVKGVCRLNPELTRLIVRTINVDFLSTEIVTNLLRRLKYT